MKLLKHFTFLTIILLGLFGCESNKWNVDLGNREMDTQWQRFELNLFEQKGEELSRERLDQLNEMYPQLMPLYAQAIMRFGLLKDSSTLATFRKFTSDENIIELVNAVEQEFPREGLQTELIDLSGGLLRYQHYFPQSTLPRIKSMISAFTYSTVVDDSLLVIGLDNYLGADFKLYLQAGIPEYKFSHFSREFIVPDALKAWLLTEFPEDAAQNLLEQMIYQGKVIFLLSVFLPEYEEHLLMNYKEDELNWCRNNAKEIWSHFLEFELFFTTENHKIKKYMGDSPFIPGFPEGSPGRVGQWQGYEIVKSFMEKNDQISLKELMELKDANKILRESKYKPN